MKPDGIGEYEWLTRPESPLAVAGCVTAVSAAVVSDISAFFGIDAEAVAPDEPVLSLEVPLSAALVELPSGCALVERDGFQGSRLDVLASLSRLARDGRAASVFWNVNEVVVFACAQRGKMVADLEVGRDDGAHLPLALRRILDTATEETNRVAIGATMVDRFTRVTLHQGDLQDAKRFLINPPPPSDADVLEFTPLYEDEPAIAKRITRLSEGDQRRLAEWIATTLIDIADVGDEPSLRPIVAGFGGRSPATVGPEGRVWISRLEREIAAATAREGEGRISPQLRRLFQLHWTVSAVEFACHPDPQTAAWRAIYAAILALTNADLRSNDGSLKEFRHALESRLA